MQLRETDMSATQGLTVYAENARLKKRVKILRERLDKEITKDNAVYAALKEENEKLKTELEASSLALKRCAQAFDSR